MRFSSVALLAASVAGVVAEDKYLGFNSGATDDKGAIKKQADFEKEFTAQQNLKGAPTKFTSVRLYTNIQPGTESSPEPIEAIPAAIKTKTKLLLGMWASGTTSVDKELTALTKAIEKYGKEFTDLVVGISVGSEDLYRISVDGVANKAGVGADIDVLTKFIKDAREKLKGTALKDAPIGHVDTWNVWNNGTVAPFVKEVDFLGVNLFPYYENGKNIPMEGGNDIKNAFPLFQTAINATLKAANGKPVWITETGWPVTGPKWEQAQPSTENAKEFWQQVGCYYIGKLNSFWYIQRDSNPENKMKFAINPTLGNDPVFDLSCPSDIKRPTTGGAAVSNGNGTSSSGNGTSTSNNSTGSASNTPGGGSAPGGGSSSGAPGSASSPPAGSSSGSMTKTNAAALAFSAIFALAAWTL